MSIVTSIDRPDEGKLAEICVLERESGKSFPTLKARFSTGKLPVLKDSKGASVLVDGMEVLDPLATVAVVNELVEAFCESASAVRGQVMIIVIGMTGVGKSTLCNWLVGHGIGTEKHEEDEDEVVTIKIDRAVDEDNKELPMFDMGHSAVHSKTFLPKVVELPGMDVVLVDFPGFFDSNGSEIRIGIDLAFRRICQMAETVHMIALLPEDSVGPVGRSFSATWQLNKAKRLLPTRGPSASTWMLAISRCHKHFMKAPTKHYKEIEKFVKEFFSELSGSMCNVSNFMFGDLSAEDFIIGHVFGVEASNTLTGDCLDAHAVAEFTKIFKTKIMYNIIEEALTGSGFAQFTDSDDIDRIVELDQANDMNKLQRGLDNLAHQLLRAHELRDTMQQALLQLADGRLMVRRIFPGIESLCQHEQPRLTHCFLEADRQACRFMMSGCIDRFYLLQTNLLHVMNMQDALVSEEQKARLQEELQSTRASLESHVMSLGFKGIEEFIKTSSAMSEFVAVVKGAAVAMMAALPSGCFGLPAFVGAMLVAAAVGTVGSAAGRHSWKEKLAAIIDTTIQTLKALAETSEANKEYILALNAQETKLMDGVVLEVESRRR